MVKKKRVSQCKRKNQTGSLCTGKYLLLYENNAPLFVCEVCESKDLTWQTFYNSYLNIWRDKDNWTQAKHRTTCILGFFCYLYKEHCGVEYIFVPNNPNPYSSKDCRDTVKLLSAFNNDAERVRKYLWWFFKKQYRSSMDIVSINYFNSAGLIRKFNLIFSKQFILNRASVLPSDFIQWCQNNTPDIFNNYELTTMNDLGALLQFKLKYNKNDSSSESKVITAAINMQLIKDNKLNIGE